VPLEGQYGCTIINVSQYYWPSSWGKHTIVCQSEFDFYCLVPRMLNSLWVVSHSIESVTVCLPNDKHVQKGSVRYSKVSSVQIG
jgi:hypothetical protein